MYFGSTDLYGRKYGRLSTQCDATWKDSSSANFSFSSTLGTCTKLRNSTVSLLSFGFVLSKLLPDILFF